MRDHMILKRIDPAWKIVSRAKYRGKRYTLNISVPLNLPPMRKNKNRTNLTKILRGWRTFVTYTL